MSGGPLSGTRLGRYELRDHLGAGGMGAVYEAWDPQLERRVALKLLDTSLTGDPRRVARFQVEARAASALTHPSIVTVYEFGEAETGDGGSVHFIAMELVEGRSLSAWKDDRPSPDAVLSLVAKLADGVAAAHRHGVVHRDLKPENVMVVAGGLPKILDFGVAKLTEVESLNRGLAAGQAALTRPATILGTVGYMSPEQVEGLPVDHRSDIFAIGCILYEFLTGREPFPGSTLSERLHATVHTTPPPLPRNLGRVQRIVDRCLAKEREERYDSAKDLALDLLEAVHSSGSRTAEPRRSRRLGTVVAVSAAIFLIIPLVPLGSSLVTPDRVSEQKQLEESLLAEQERNRRLAELLERQNLDREHGERLRADLESSYRDLLSEVREHVKSDESERSTLRQRLSRADAELENYRKQLNRREKEEHLASIARQLGGYIDSRFEANRLTVTFPGSYFRAGRSAIDFKAHPILRYLADEIRQKRGIRVDIEGHTDSSGDASRNLVLSQERAEGVRAILIAAGIDPERITAVGRGELLPVSDNATLEGRSLNRRVELSVMYAP